MSGSRSKLAITSEPSSPACAPAAVGMTCTVTVGWRTAVSMWSSWPVITPGSPTGLAQHTVINDDPQVGRVIAGQDDLPVQARGDKLVDLLIAVPWPGRPQNRAGVPFGLQQPIHDQRPDQTVRQVAKAARFSDETADAILAHFVRGGQLTAGGVMQAVTSVAQTLDDADAAHDLEAQAIRVLDLAAA